MYMNLIFIVDAIISTPKIVQINNKFVIDIKLFVKLLFFN